MMSDDLVGKALGQYQIEELIGRGGMASVYKGYQPRMRRHVAIKVLPNVLAADPNFMARFDREAQTIAQLEHRSILPVYDYGEQDNTTYIVMRYIDSGSLADKMKLGTLSHDEIQHITRQIAEGLDYAHRKGVVHRDLKPDNIFLNAEGDALLGDFGIAQITEGTQELTGNSIIGTPAYMSPEQGMGEPLDGRSDIYALGVILFELFTGRVPFESETPMGLVVKHITNNIPDPRTLKSDLSNEITAVILKATAKSPDDRYASTLELADDLDRAFGMSQTMAGTVLPTAPATVILSDKEMPAVTLPTSDSPAPTPKSIAFLPPQESFSSHQSAQPVDPPLKPTTTMDTPKRKIPIWGWALGGVVLLAICGGIGGALINSLTDSDEPEVTLDFTPRATAFTATDSTATPQPSNTVAIIAATEVPATVVNLAPTNILLSTQPPPPATDPPLPPAFSIAPPAELGIRIVDDDRINTSGGRVRYEFLGTQDGTATIFVQPSPDFDVMIQVIDLLNNNAILTTVDEFNAGGQESLNFRPNLPLGYYAFIVLGFEGSTGDFNTSLFGSTEIAYTVEAGMAIAGRSGGDDDSVSVLYEGEANDSITIEIVPINEFDVVAKIYDIDMLDTALQTGVIPDPLMEVDESIDTESFIYTFPEENVYFIDVSGYENAVGDFFLTITE